MNKIAVLVDLSDGSKAALKQARVLSEKSGAELVVVHIAHDQVPDEIHGNILDGFVRPIVGPAPNVTMQIGRGNFMDVIPGLLREINPDLVVLCTHGIHGLVQNLFGAHVLKLVQSVHFPCLVVQESSFIDPQGPRQILLPASPFSDFQIKMKECGKIAKIFDSDVTYYEIDKYLGDTEESISVNGKLAANHMAGLGVRFKNVLEENKDRSLGHAQQTINYADMHQYGLICLSSNTHQEYMAMGKADKEKFLTNNKSIPVLCCG